jgi:hypothetical protein
VSDIVTRLREPAIGGNTRPLRLEAAEEIERLREALQEILRLGVKFDAKGTHSKRVVEIARAALAAPREET